jgi:hypothetical protein
VDRAVLGARRQHVGAEQRDPLGLARAVTAAPVTTVLDEEVQQHERAPHEQENESDDWSVRHPRGSNGRRNEERWRRARRTGFPAGTGS